VPQEAYYWYYSLNPDLSYFDHPPMVAYSIWLATKMFGHSIFSIKFMAVIWSVLINIFLYMTVINALSHMNSEYKRQIAFVTIIFYNLTIFSHLYAVTMVPDSPLLFFWLLIIFFFQKYIESRKITYIYLTGIALGFALLSKYTAIAILPAIFLILVLDHDARKIFLSPHPYLAIFVSVIIASPIFIWNLNHDWISFKFQFNNRANELRPMQTIYFWQLLASQLFMLTPLMFALFLITTKRVILNWYKDQKARFFFITSIFIIGGFIALSFDTLVKMNWLLPGYIGLFVSTVLVFRNEDILKKRIFKVGAVFSAILIIVAHSILLIPNIPLGEGNTWSGWRETAQNISNIRDKLGGKDKIFVFSNSYKTASLLKYYLPGNEPVFAQNIYGEPALQFDVWGIPSSLEGKSALFIFTDRREYKPEIEKVKKYFDQVSFVAEFNIYFLETIEIRKIYCYYANNYHHYIEQKTLKSGEEKFSFINNDEF
jgi:4-amino-4-deoxy-L-arabinose transferase-like glycosyltransferase